MRWETQQQAGAYLAAIIDGEGHVNVNYKNKKISVFNKELALLQACCDACDILEITYNMHPTKIKECYGWTFSIWSELNFRIVLDKVPLQHPEKRAKLEFLVTSYTRRMKQPVTKVKI